MEQAILGVVGLVLMVVLHHDWARRADIAALREEASDLRKDVTEGFAAHRAEPTDLRKDVTDGFAAHRAETRKQIETSAARTDARIDNLTTAVIDLARAVGKAEGRTETLKLVE